MGLSGVYAASIEQNDGERRSDCPGSKYPAPRLSEGKCKVCSQKPLLQSRDAITNSWTRRREQARGVTREICLASTISGRPSKLQRRNAACHTEHAYSPGMFDAAIREICGPSQTPHGSARVAPRAPAEAAIADHAAAPRPYPAPGQAAPPGCAGPLIASAVAVTGVRSRLRFVQQKTVSRTATPPPAAFPPPRPSPR